MYNADTQEAKASYVINSSSLPGTVDIISIQRDSELFKNWFLLCIMYFVMFCPDNDCGTAVKTCW